MTLKIKKMMLKLETLVGTKRQAKRLVLLHREPQGLDAAGLPMKHIVFNHCRFRLFDKSFLEPNKSFVILDSGMSYCARQLPAQLQGHRDIVLSSSIRFFFATFSSVHYVCRGCITAGTHCSFCVRRERETKPGR